MQLKVYSSINWLHANKKWKWFLSLTNKAEIMEDWVSNVITSMLYAKITLMHFR